MAALSGIIPTLVKDDSEHSSWLLVFPLISVVLYYLLFFPSSRLHLVLAPLAVGFLSLIAWSVWNRGGLDKLRLRRKGLGAAVGKGALTGVCLALFNLFVILELTVWLGYSYDFLRETPHAGLPFRVMFPLGILVIGFGIEVLFRGWILGRFWALLKNIRGGAALSIFLSALLFSFDPFMVAYFRGYHWLALSDGIVWGALLWRTQNLFSTVAAHTVEVWIVYFILKIFYA